MLVMVTDTETIPILESSRFAKLHKIAKKTKNGRTDRRTKEGKELDKIEAEILKGNVPDGWGG